MSRRTSLTSAWKRDRFGETERHHEVLIMPRRCVEGRLPLISFPDLDQMISVAEIQLGEDGGPLQQLKSRGDEWEGILVLDRDLVQTPVIDTRTQGLVLLFYKEEPCARRGGGRTDDACCHRVADVLLHGLSFWSR